MRYKFIRKRHTKGFTLLELLISLGIIAIIGIGLFEIFDVATKSWSKGVTELNQSEEGNQDFILIENTLRQAASITNLSLSSSNSGYLEFEDADGDTYAIFLNSGTNQGVFGGNSYASSSIIGQFKESGVVVSTEVLLDSVTEFSVTSYVEDPNYTKIVSPNNVVNPMSTQDISSLKLYINRKVGDTNYSVYKLIQLSKLEYEASSHRAFGTDYNGTTEFPFNSHLSFAGFTTQNIGIVPDTNDIPDGLQLLTPTATVTIRGTGMYYHSIQDAIDAAATGNQVLVAQKLGGYTESLNIKSGVSVIGGYDPVFWYRNPDRFSTTLTSSSGGSSKVTMQSNSSIEGLRLAGDSHTYGIYAKDASVNISRMSIDEANIGIYIENGSARLVGNRVTGNNQCLVIKDANNVSVMRNWFYSENGASEANVEVEDSNNVSIRNNVVVEGEVGVSVQGQAGDFSTGEIINNVIRGAITNGVSGVNATLTVYNNFMFENDFATHFSPFGSIDILNNVLVDNDSGSSTTEPSLPGNTEKNTDTYVWGFNDPYFETLATYELKDSAPDTIDLGHANAAYNDTYTNGFPGKGTSTNDVGAYGGPFAGRIGASSVTVLEDGDDFETELNESFPGDVVVVASGNYTLADALELKEGQLLTASGLGTAVLVVDGNSAVDTMSDVRLENLVIDGNGETGFVVNQADRVQLASSVIYGANVGIDSDNSDDLVISHVTGFENTTCMDVSNSDGLIQYCIVAGSSTGISNAGGNITLESNLFFDNGSDSTGTFTETNRIEDDPQFRDSDSNNFLLLSDSSAINVSGNLDAGAYEYYVNSGNATSPVLSFDGTIGVASVVMDMFGSEGLYPDAVDGYTEVKLAIIVDNVTRYVDENGNLSSTPVTFGSFSESTDQTLTVNVPPTIITDSCQLKVFLEAYQFSRTPYVNRLQLNW